MVDEEDEKVLTTEELRVEVSRFLKGVGSLKALFGLKTKALGLSTP